ncbi:MAG: uroporphyrinogen decarboxylase family protein, partial [Phycisphaerae bacterium]|nr:uroporphyrinogen decarboxylase family protein [Phycisphaerae bacterium]
MISARENWLRAVEFRRPEWIPIAANFSPITWRTYGERLEEVVLRHPILFPSYKQGSVDFDAPFGPVYREGEMFTDNWGCVWYNTIDGLEGQPVEHPLADWNNLASYRLPDPETCGERDPRDWDRISTGIAEQKRRGELTYGDGERLFDRLYFLRGWENLMLDFACDDPHLPQLIDMLTEYELKLVNKSLDIGVDVVGFHTDIGTHKALMISPRKFRRYIKPMFMKIFRACRRAGAHVVLSSDGRLVDIVEDLIECGVSVHDPQVRANTIDGTAAAYKGRLCANVDLDRQMFPFCKPDDIRRQVEEVVEKVGSPEGGLMLLASVYGADVPLE